MKKARFDVAFRVKAKHGIIYNYMQDNDLTVKELAKETGISLATLTKIINFKWFPKDTITKGNYQNRTIVSKLCAFFACDIEDLFPEEIIKMIKNDSEIAKVLQEEQIITKSVDLNHFLSFKNVRQIEMSYSMDLDGEIDRNELLPKNVEPFLDMLTSREKKVVKKYFGIGYDKALTFDEIGQEIGKVGNRANQIFAKAMEKMRRPKLLTHIKNFYEPSGQVKLEAKKRIIENYKSFEHACCFSDISNIWNKIRKELNFFDIKLEDIGLSQEKIEESIKNAEKRIYGK